MIGLMAWLSVNLWQTRENEMQRMRDDLKSIHSDLNAAYIELAVVKTRIGL